jgi:hypothetical protein
MNFNLIPFASAFHTLKAYLLLPEIILLRQTE